MRKSRLTFSGFAAGSIACCSTTLKRPDNAPERNSMAMVLASSSVKLPDITPVRAVAPLAPDEGIHQDVNLATARVNCRWDAPLAVLID
jgi:hypothetical protein